MSYCSSERYNVLVTSSYERAVILRVYHFMSAPDLNIDGVMTTLFSNTDNMEWPKSVRRIHKPVSLDLLHQISMQINSVPMNIQSILS